MLFRVVLLFLVACQGARLHSQENQRTKVSGRMLEAGIPVRFKDESGEWITGSVKLQPDQWEALAIDYDDSESGERATILVDQISEVKEDTSTENAGIRVKGVKLGTDEEVLVELQDESDDVDAGFFGGVFTILSHLADWVSDILVGYADEFIASQPEDSRKYSDLDVAPVMGSDVVLGFQYSAELERNNPAATEALAGDLGREQASAELIAAIADKSKSKLVPQIPVSFVISSPYHEKVNLKERLQEAALLNEVLALGAQRKHHSRRHHHHHHHYRHEGKPPAQPDWAPLTTETETEAEQRQGQAAAKKDYDIDYRFAESPHHHGSGRRHHGKRFEDARMAVERARPDRYGMPKSKNSLVGGVNLGPDSNEWGGTLGGFFVDCADNLYAVSNRHVLDAGVDTDACQPGRLAIPDSMGPGENAEFALDFSGNNGKVTLRDETGRTSTFLYNSANMGTTETNVDTAAKLTWGNANVAAVRVNGDPAARVRLRFSAAEGKRKKSLSSSAKGDTQASVTPMDARDGQADQNPKAISAAVWNQANGVVTITANDHDLQTGDSVTITGVVNNVNPGGFDQAGKVITVVDNNQFTFPLNVAKAAGPGGYQNSGRVVLDAVPGKPITGAAWNGVTDLVTITCVDHGFADGDRVTITGVNPAAYNQNGVEIVRTGDDTFTYPQTVNPTAYVAGGQAVENGAPGVCNSIGKVTATGGKMVISTGFTGTTYAKKKMDVAVAKVDYDLRPNVRCAIKGIGPVVNSAKAVVGDRVRKYGARTHYTEGVVSQRYADTSSEYRNDRWRLAIKGTHYPAFGDVLRVFPNLPNTPSPLNEPGLEFEFRDMYAPLIDLHPRLRERDIVSRVDCTSLVTLTTAARHGLSTNTQVRIVGVNPNSYNEAVRVTSVGFFSSTLTYPLPTCTSAAVKPLSACVASHPGVKPTVITVQQQGPVRILLRVPNHGLVVGDFVVLTQGAFPEYAPGCRVFAVGGLNKRDVIIEIPVGMGYAPPNGNVNIPGAARLRKVIVGITALVAEQTLTVVTSQNHGLSDGTVVSWSGAPKGLDRENVPIKVANNLPKQFTYTIPSGKHPALSGTAQPKLRATITRTRDVQLSCEARATLTFGAAHNIGVGAQVSVTAADGQQLRTAEGYQTLAATVTRVLGGGGGALSTQLSYDVACPNPNPTNPHIARLRLDTVTVFSTSNLVQNAGVLTYTSDMRSPFQANGHVFIEGCVEPTFNGEFVVDGGHVAGTLAIRLRPVLPNVLAVVGGQGAVAGSVSMRNIAPMDLTPTAGGVTVDQAKCRARAANQHSFQNNDVVHINGASDLNYRFGGNLVRVSGTDFTYDCMGAPPTASPERAAPVTATHEFEWELTGLNTLNTGNVRASMNGNPRALPGDLIKVHGVGINAAQLGYAGRFRVVNGGNGLVDYLRPPVNNPPAGSGKIILKTSTLVTYSTLTWTAPDSGTLTANVGAHTFVAGDYVVFTCPGATEDQSASWCGKSWLVDGATDATHVVVTGSDGMAIEGVDNANTYQYRISNNAGSIYLGYSPEDRKTIFDHALKHGNMLIFTWYGDSGSFILKGNSVVGILTGGPERHTPSSDVYVTLFSRDWGEFYSDDQVIEMSDVLDNINKELGNAGPLSVCGTMNHAEPVGNPAAVCAFTDGLCHPRPWCEVDPAQHNACRLRVIPPH